MQILVSIGKVAEMFGVTTQTIRNWVKAGKLNEFRTVGGHRRFDLDEVHALKGVPKQDNRKTVIYTRVSGNDQKEDLERQVEEIKQYCEKEKIEDAETIKDVGSGINYNKKGLKKLIREIIQGKIKKVVINYTDRLLRFGSEILFQICELMNVEVVILRDSKEKDFYQKLVEDVCSILVVYCSKIYGKRSHEKRKESQKKQEKYTGSCLPFACL